METLTNDGTGAFVGKGNGLANLLKGNWPIDRFVADPGGADTFSGGNGIDVMDFLASAGSRSIFPPASRRRGRRRHLRQHGAILRVE